MATDASKALQYETEFLSGVETNFETAKGKYLRGSIWKRSGHDESDRLRALLAENRNYDRELLKTLPANRRIALHGFERRWLFGKRRTGMAIASVLSPLNHYAANAGEGGPPIDLGELTEHVHQLVGDRRVPHFIGVCSPTGFSEEARRARLDIANVTVVLVEPDGSGGWRISGAGSEVDPRLLKIFDPEGTKQKVDRVGSILEEHSADLLTGGVSVSSIARKANLPVPVVREGFARVAASDPELRLTEKDGDFLLFRGAPVQRQETRSMNVIDRIKQLLSGEASETEKINLLAERRAALAQRRDRIYEDIGKLEKRESELLEQGKAAKSSVPRRRLAAQLAQMRKDIARQNTTASMLNQQINIISTDIHNLTLIQQGDMAKLPDTTELTEHAVEAEEMLETLKADSELVGQLEMGTEEALASDEELLILREFEAADEKPAAAVEPTATPPASLAESAAPPEPPARESPRAKEDTEPHSPERGGTGRAADAEPT